MSRVREVAIGLPRRAEAGRFYGGNLVATGSPEVERQPGCQKKRARR
jgi:hypothetical protein